MGTILKILVNGPVTVTLDSNRDPIVEGFGCRSKGSAYWIFCKG